MLEHRRRCSVVGRAPSIVVTNAHYDAGTIIKMQNRNKLYLINCCWSLGAVIRSEESHTGTRAIQQPVRRHRCPLKYGQKMLCSDFRNGKRNDINEKNLVHFLFSSWVWLQWNELISNSGPQLSSMHWFRSVLWANCSETKHGKWQPVAFDLSDEKRNVLKLCGGHNEHYSISKNGLRDRPSGGR